MEAAVEEKALHPIGADPATDAVGGFEDFDPAPGFVQFYGTGQAGQASSDHGDVEGRRLRKWAHFGSDVRMRRLGTGGGWLVAFVFEGPTGDLMSKGEEAVEFSPDQWPAKEGSEPAERETVTNRIDELGAVLVYGKEVVTVFPGSERAGFLSINEPGFGDLVNGDPALFERADSHFDDSAGAVTDRARGFEDGGLLPWRREFLKCAFAEMPLPQPGGRSVDEGRSFEGGVWHLEGYDDQADD